ncbi:hypothetical protein [Neptunitalea lumnitzerae]|uniref:Uncharacterized protein n=1 Tax=Neptunitalea lumnitzerae TaxID=2965509 RepID=A0ABQ5MJ30_9FLAO|nr:hypothetical protein [Neptunitalea sp. Y10]GLB49390.1 hypothetical protein Y10_17580 [Neptunitalea sp. Y10]
MSNLEVPKESLTDKAHSIVKGAFGAIPFAGGVASETFGLILSQPITKRREEWMQAVVDKLNHLEQKSESFTIENLKKNDEFVTFLIEASQIAFKTHQTKKLYYLQNAIGNYFNNQLEFDKKHSFLRIIDELTPTHFIILSYLSGNEEYIIENINGYESLLKHYLENNPQIEKYYFRKCIRDLENVSLIRISRDFQDYIGGSGYATDERAPSIKLLDFGAKLINNIVDQKHAK